MREPAILSCVLLAAVAATCRADTDADRYLIAVRQYADNVLRYGRDTYGPKKTPLFVDGINVDTHEPPEWKNKGETWIVSNFASQQNMFRVLDGLTGLTGDRKYRGAAVRAVGYALKNLCAQNGLLYWGGHYAYDAAGDKPIKKQEDHELKQHYPYYELMWRVDPAVTKRFVEAFWRAHVYDWNNLDMNRHGRYDRDTSGPWPENYVGGPVFFTSERGCRSFVNTGSDLIYAGTMLHEFTGERMPLVWAQRLAYRYVETRNPKTGLGGYEYSRLKEDRAETQFSGVPRLKGHPALEGTIVDSKSRMRFGALSIVQLKLSEMLGEEGSDFRKWAIEDLRAYAKHAYNPADNTFSAMLTDGTKLTGADIQKNGYYGKVGTSGKFAPIKGDGTFLWAYAMAYRISGDAYMWQMARNIARALGLGDIGDGPKSAAKLDMNTDCSDPKDLLSCLELCRSTGGRAFLDLAVSIGDNILERRFHKGFFVRSDQHLYARFDDMEPLALLALAAMLRGEPGAVPDAWPTDSFFDCTYDGHGSKTDTSFIYSRTRSTVEPAPGKQAE